MRPGTIGMRLLLRRASLITLVASSTLPAACGDEGPETRAAPADSSLAVTAVGTPATAAEVTVTGRVVDAESREGVPGGYVIVLSPGVSFADWERSPAEQVEGLMAGAAVTDSLGRYEVADLPRGRDFTVVVAAPRHDPAVFEDGLTVRVDDPPYTRLADVELDPR